MKKLKSLIIDTIVISVGSPGIVINIAWIIEGEKIFYPIIFLVAILPAYIMAWHSFIKTKLDIYDLIDIIEKIKNIKQ